MSIASSSGLFVGKALTEREVTLADGTVATWHFAKVSSLEWTQFQMAMAVGDNEVVRARAALRLVMLSLCEPDGKQALTWDQVCALEPSVSTQLQRIVAEVCRPKDDPGKASTPGVTSGSGT